MKSFAKRWVRNYANRHEKLYALYTSFRHAYPSGWVMCVVCGAPFVAPTWDELEAIIGSALDLNLIPRRFRGFVRSMRF